MKKLLVALLVILSTSAMAQQKLGHVNSQVLLDTMPSYKAAIKTLKKVEADGYQELTEMESALQAEYEIYMKNKPNNPPVVNQLAEEKLQTKQQVLVDREKALQREIQTISQSLNEPILDRIKLAVKTVADRKKIAYVIDETTTLYFENGIDLTNEVITELLRLDAEAMKP